MKTFFKTLKKFTFPIILIIVLLCIQAICDLSLPDYTSKIVNIGIQQNGITSITPQVMSESFYSKIILFMSSEEKETIDQNYTLILIGDNNYLEKYPLLEKENIYILNDNSNLLDDTMAFPISISFNIDNLPLNNIEMDNYTFLKSLDYSNRMEIINPIKEQYQQMGEGLTTQAAINIVKEEYQHIGIDINRLQSNYIAETGLKMLAIALSAMVITIASTYISSKVAAYFSRDLRGKLVNKVMSFSNFELEKFSISSLITRSTNDIQQIQSFLAMLFRIVIYAPIIGIGAYSKVSQNDMGWIIGIVVFIILIIMIILLIVALPKFQKVQKFIDKLNLVAREMLSGILVIRAFSNEKKEQSKFDDANKDLYKVNLFVGRTMSIMMPLMTFIMNAVCILIIWVGADKINNGTIQVGTLMAFITYAIQIIISFLMISIVSIILPRALVSIKRICQVFDQELSIKDLENTKKINKDSKVLLEFKDVYFRYHDALEDVLQNINFTAESGQITAFIGSTGSGKSTLINLIPRFFDVTGGKILINGTNIKDVKLQDLRSKIGFIPQKGMLFSGTIASNISLGLTSITKEKLHHAAKISQSAEFINQKDKKYKDLIAQGGTNVSGGQRQRLAIARAVAINPDIYIFDDSFSALDYKTDKKLRLALSKNLNDKIILIVAQRISTIMNADQIIVLDKGQIVGMGKHKELLNTCRIYKEIAFSQLSKEELIDE